MVNYLLPLCLAAFCSPAISQTTALAPAMPPIDSPVEAAAPITLDMALGLALRYNHEIAAAGYEVEAVAAAVTQAGALPNPVISAELLDRRTANRETTILLTQPIELGGKRQARVLAAQRGLDAAAVDLVLKRAAIRADVITAYFDVLIAQEQLRLAREAAELAQRATTTAAKRVAAGKVSPVEETRARVAQAGVGLDLIRAGSVLSVARKRMTSIWGNRAPRFLYAEGNVALLPEAASPAALAYQMNRAPAVLRARLEVERSQALARLELARRLPDISLSFGTRRSEELGRSQAIFGVSVPLPLFDRNQGKVLESARRVDQAREQLAATELRLDADLSQVWERFDAARQQAHVLRDEIVPGAQSAYDAAATGFEFGKFSFLDVLDAQRTLLQAKSQYLNALGQAHQALAEAGRLTGLTGPLTEPITEPITGPLANAATTSKP